MGESGMANRPAVRPVGVRLYRRPRKGEVKAMRIEDLSAAAAKLLPENDLHSFRARFVQLYADFYHDPGFVTKGNRTLLGLTRRTFIEKYVLLRKEMHRRLIKIKTPCAIDEEVEARIKKAALAGVDVPEFGDVILFENFVAVTGSFLNNPKAADHVNLIIAKAGRDEGLELRIGAAVREVLAKASAFVYNEAGPGKEGPFIPLFDLVLRAKGETARVAAPAEKRVEKKLTMKQRAAFEAESEKICESKKTAAAAKPHKFQAAEFTHPNGHPRCLLCGDEQREGNVCAGVKAEKAAVPVDVSKPEVTDTLVRLPVRDKVEGHEIRTIPISEADGISALEDMTDKEIVTYLFDKEKWTLESATKWVEEHKARKSANAKVDCWIEFIKVDAVQHLVGGIVYEPQVVDTQGDWAEEEDITKAMHRFMEKYSIQTARIKVMHEGESHTFPIIESFQPETDITKGGKVVKKGSWWIMVKVTNDKIWKAIDDGRLNGFSMGGRAKGEQGSPQLPA